MPLKKYCLVLLYCLATLGLFSQDQWMFVGTYSVSGSYGIYVYRFSPATGTASLMDSISTENPSYLALSPDGAYLYSITENGNTKPGEISAFAFDKKTGHLRFINEQHSGGDHPCYVAVNAGGTWVAVANYTGGSLSMLAVNKDGSLQAPVQTIRHIGSGPLQSRQAKPHVHTSVFSPQDDFVFATDLGTDKVVAYPFNPGAAVPLDSSHAKHIQLAPASGPRHLAFHPQKPFLYVLEEMAGKVAVFQQSAKGWNQVQSIVSDTISPAPDKGSADIHLSPDGKFLYTSNRGKANNISIYAVDQSSGKLKLLGTQPVLGEKPRNFVIDPTGNYLIVANQNSNNIVCFKRDMSTGLLSFSGISLHCPSPVCLKMLSVE